MSSKNFFLPPLPINSESSSSLHHVTIFRRKNRSNGTDETDIEEDDLDQRPLLVNSNEERSAERFSNSSNNNHNNNMGAPVSMSRHVSSTNNNADDEVNTPLLSPLKINHQQQPSSSSRSSSSWPSPLNDEAAIQLQQLPFQSIDDYEIHKTSIIDQIKAEVHQTNNISIRIITWNQQAKPIPSPLNDEEVYSQLFLTSSSKTAYRYHHLFVIGTQECENSISKSIFKPIKEKWERTCIDALGDDYVFIQGHALQASHLAVLAHKSITHLITNVKSYAVPTGICNTLGNKGGIGVSLNVGKTSFCFLTAHLAAFQDQIDRRTYEFETISKEIADKLGGKRCNNSDETNDTVQKESGSYAVTATTVLSVGDNGNDRNEYEEFSENNASDDNETKCKCCNSYCSIYCCCHCNELGHHVNPLLCEFDNVFWGGDFNYRINATRDVVDSLLKENRHDILVSNDQLNLLLQFEKTFAGFVEGPLTFRPTYKYDIGTDVYDSSLKRRIPSWTDRILYKNCPSVKLLSYFCAQEIRISDHRPVYASFNCKIDIDRDEETLEGNNNLRSESISEVCVIS